MQVIVGLATWLVIDEGVDTGHPKGKMQDDLVVGSPWHQVVAIAQDHDVRPVGAERPLRFEPDPDHPTGATAVVAEVVAHYPSAMDVNDPDGHTLLSVGPVRFWMPGEVQGPRVEGIVALDHDHDFPIEHPAWSRIGPPPHGRAMRGVVRRIRRVPVYMAPPRPGSAEEGRSDGVRAGLGAPHDVPSVLARVEAKQPEGFALPLDRPAPDAGTDGSWCNPEAGGFWTSQGCLVHLELDDAPAEPPATRGRRKRARSR
jgi:hypothetical protein